LKSDPLDQEAFARKRLNPEVQRRLEAHAALLGRDTSQVRVLDFGCGRGEAVLLLRELGYEAYGVDVEPGYIDNAAGYFAGLGLDARELLRVSEPDKDFPFEAESMDFVFSEQVLEHVEDLDSVARKIARVLRPGGLSFHVFPPHRGVLEEHLWMPFVHWLPKGAVRRAAIALGARLGMGPREWLREVPVRERARRWAAYSDKHTFYRSPATLRALFGRHLLQLHFVADEHPRLRSLPGFGAALRLPALQSVVRFVLTYFVAVHLVARKGSPGATENTAARRSG